MFWLICIIGALFFLQFFCGIPVFLYLWVAIGLPVRFVIWLHRRIAYKWLPDETINAIEEKEAETICLELNRNSIYYTKKLFGIKDE